MACTITKGSVVVKSKAKPISSKKKTLNGKSAKSTTPARPIPTSKSKSKGITNKKISSSASSPSLHGNSKKKPTTITIHEKNKNVKKYVQKKSSTPSSAFVDKESNLSAKKAAYMATNKNQKNGQKTPPSPNTFGNAAKSLPLAKAMHISAFNNDSPTSTKDNHQHSKSSTSSSNNNTPSSGQEDDDKFDGNYKMRTRNGSKHRVRDRPAQTSIVDKLILQKKRDELEKMAEAEEENELQLAAKRMNSLPLQSASSLQSAFSLKK
eukprot:CAMPEP_0202690822 /NCGR_PEP_ID=MMETSP1385-20130828/5713_1 /ASSEMBLY_ACC=CAM_ASM_000861 /TAXON_ID=933848 /ORGANISM="Elphidium margaritaceum" /LENGTH=264 /DNA_ID=CAMNT_0049346135 /DNA_START=51 /DNA_END=845 /DNA_ORIENTATION=-